MRQLKKVASRVVAFSMAAMLTCSGFLDNMTIGSRPVTGNVSGITDVQAATVTGTVGADTFSWDNASVYFLLTDRFKNGNTANDHSYNRGLDKNGNQINIADERGTFHGGDFAGITQAIKEGYFNNLGVNALWISAPYEQIHGYIVGGDGKSFAHYSYHGYYVLDYTSTDANFGTEEEFKEMVDTAHENGLRVVIDIVLNHAGYNSLYDMNEYNFGVVKSGWDSYYYSMSNVNNTDYHSYIDYNADATQWCKWWGPDWIRAGLPGYTAGGSDDKTMSLTGLPDFRTESTNVVGIPEFLKTKWTREGRYNEEVNALKTYLSENGYEMTVTNCISYWLSSWVREYGVDGFRCDTAKHVEYGSWKRLHDMCTDALKDWKAANPDKKLDDLDFWMTGEAWGHGVSYDGYYTEAKFDSMINFDTQGGGSLALGSVADKYSSYASQINSKDDFNVLSYISSHDSVLARGDQKYLGSALLMLPGGIQIFYGDETNRPLDTGYAFDGNGGAGHILRTDMNWDSMDEDVLSHWQKVGQFRNKHIAVGAGTHKASAATSGVGFTRTYSKNGISDRIAAVIGASANTSVTIDVNGVWEDGSRVTNYYDGSSAVVANGKVTFNSGANGTILICDLVEDGKPFVTIKGNAEFEGTQTVTVNIKDAESAIISVDGGKKFEVKDGDTFVIGETAYPGDTVVVEYKAENEKGSVKGKATFKKIDTNGGGTITEPSKVRVKMSDGSAPYLYAWVPGTTTTTYLSGVWPGTKLTEKDSEGYYVYSLDTTSSYNIIFNNGSGSQTDNIEGLKGTTTFEVQAGFGDYKKISGEEEIITPITIRVKPYGSTSPYLYVWNGTTKYNGEWPGKTLTDKDSDGNYVFKVEGASSVNCIVNNGAGSQSKDLTNIKGDTLITVKSADCSNCTVEQKAEPESKFALMKSEARSVKNMTASDYTIATWNRLYSYIEGADALVALGEEEADAKEVEAMYNNIVEAKEALVLEAPKVTSATIGSKVVTGTAACESVVTVTIAGTKYTATADEVTGVWTITANSNLTSTSVITTSATRDGLSSETGTYSIGGGSTALAISAKGNGSTSVNVTAGTKVTIAASASGGSGSYTYKYVLHNVTTNKWSNLTSYGSSASYTYTPVVAGTYELFAVVKDSAGTVVTSNAVKVTATGGVAALTISAKGNGSTSLNVTAGTKVTIAATASGGSGSYTYKYVLHNVTTNKWSNLTTYGSSASYAYTPATAGTYELFAVVKDTAGTVVTSNAVKVIVTGGTAVLTVTAKGNGNTSLNVSEGTKVTITATTTGGNGSCTYKYVLHNITTNKWSNLTAYGSSASYAYTFRTAGTYEVFAVAQDSAGTVSTSNAVKVKVS